MKVFVEFFANVVVEAFVEASVEAFVEASVKAFTEAFVEASMEAFVEASTAPIASMKASMVEAMDASTGSEAFMGFHAKCMYWRRPFLLGYSIEKSRRNRSHYRSSGDKKYRGQKKL